MVWGRCLLLVSVCSWSVKSAVTRKPADEDTDFLISFLEKPPQTFLGSEGNSSRSRPNTAPSQLASGPPLGQLSAGAVQKLQSGVSQLNDEAAKMGNSLQSQLGGMLQNLRGKAADTVNGRQAHGQSVESSQQAAGSFLQGLFGSRSSVGNGSVSVVDPGAPKKQADDRRDTFTTSPGDPYGPEDYSPPEEANQTVIPSADFFYRTPVNLPGRGSSSKASSTLGASSAVPGPQALARSDAGKEAGLLDRFDAGTIQSTLLAVIGLFLSKKIVVILVVIGLAVGVWNVTKYVYGVGTTWFSVNKATSLQTGRGVDTTASSLQPVAAAIVAGLDGAGLLDANLSGANPAGSAAAIANSAAPQIQSPTASVIPPASLAQTLAPVVNPPISIDNPAVSLGNQTVSLSPHSTSAGAPAASSSNSPASGSAPAALPRAPTATAGVVAVNTFYPVPAVPAANVSMLVPPIASPSPTPVTSLTSLTSPAASAATTSAQASIGTSSLIPAAISQTSTATGNALILDTSAVPSAAAFAVTRASSVPTPAATAMPTILPALSVQVSSALPVILPAASTASPLAVTAAQVQTALPANPTGSQIVPTLVNKPPPPTGSNGTNNLLATSVSPNSVPQGGSSTTIRPPAA